MSIAQFSLVGTVPVTILREEAGSFINGRWTEAVQTQVVINANIHPFSDYEVYMMPEADRSRSWMWLFTSSLVRGKKEGASGNGSDRFLWDGDMYEVVRTTKWGMSIQDHFEARCARIELSPN